MRILLISHNDRVRESIEAILRVRGAEYDVITTEPVWATIINTGYSLIISAHCKSIFPKEVINAVRCVNIHPGLLPDERGWYPHVFSMASGRTKTGATIHEIDEKIDHGKIVCQREVDIYPHDTSASVYDRIINAEVSLFAEFYSIIVEQKSGKYHSKAQYETLCRLNMEDKGTMRDHIRLLRSLSHGEYSNAWFADENGDRIYIRVVFNKEGDGV